MKFEKIGANTYRARKTHKGKKYVVMFDHKPTQSEAEQAFAEKIASGDAQATTATFEAACKSHDEIKYNVLSPATRKGYKTCYNALSDEFKALKLKDIDQKAVQAEINRYALNHAPKSCKNLHGYITAVLSLYRPDLALNTKMPGGKVFKSYVPTDEEVAKFLAVAKSTEFYIPIMLACHGMRRSEIVPITKADLKGNILTISKAMVEDEKGKFVLKEYGKNDDSTRQIYISDEIADYINEHGYVFKGNPNKLTNVVHVIQDIAGVPRFRLHDLRHYYATMAHANKIPDKFIQANCGWKTRYTMDKVYKEAAKDKIIDMEKKASSLIGGK